MATIELLSEIAKSVRNTPTMVNLFNWNEIAKLPLPDSFIIEHADYLNWDVLARHQNLSVALTDLFDDLLKKRMHILVLNTNLHPEVFRKYAAFMDWENAQKHQRFTPELLEYYASNGSMELLIVLQHQKIPENIIENLLQPVIDRKNWTQLRRYLALVFTYQTVSNTFINKYLVLENTLYEMPQQSEGGFASNVPQIILVDLPLVIKHQKLDEEFLTAFCIPHIKAREEICRSQKLSSKFMNEHFDLLDVRKLLKYQHLDEPTLMRCCERSVFRQKVKPRVDKILSSINFLNAIHVASNNNDNNTSQDNVLAEPTTMVDQNTPAEEPLPEETQAEIDRRLSYAILLLEKQDYSLDLARQIIDSIPNAARKRTLWNTVFLRTLAPIGSDSYLGCSTETVVEQVVPNVNWDAIAETKLTATQLDGIISMAADRMPWYLYLKKNQLSEAHITALHNADKIDAITWWRLLTNSRETPLGHAFMANYGDRKKWWNYVNGAQFYAASLQALDNVDTIDVEGTNLAPIASKADLRAFLNDFVLATKWQTLLQDELLPEWFLQVFAHKLLVNRIPKYWWSIARWQNLTQKFIERNVANLGLQMVLTYQTVSEEFIRSKLEFFTPENWKTINTRQNLSDEFRAEFAGQLA